jgi:uncharacterized protein (UPF0332 family)
MTDVQALYEYRLNQAQTTLADAELMLKQSVSPRSIINRAYYAMFYMTIALFIRAGVEIITSKHTGIIGVFDREFIINGRIDRKYSQMLHNMFDDRQEFDYKEFTDVSNKDAEKAVRHAREFIEAIKSFISKISI